MPRVFEEWFPVGTGADQVRVGYSWAKRGKVYVVRFDGPDGTYRRVSTGCVEKNAAVIQAEKIVLAAYVPDHAKMPKAATWDDVVAKLETALIRNNNRDKTYRDYASVIANLRATVDTTGPGDVDEAKARDFRDKFTTNTYARGNDTKKRKAARFKRTHKTVNRNVEKLRSLWNKWLVKSFKLTTANPWASIDLAEVDDHETTAPSEDVVAALLKWVGEEYPGEFMQLFIKAKSYIGCRLADICALRSDQLKDFQIVFTGDQLKARNRRTVPASPEARQLYADLDRIKGPVYLWESFPHVLTERAAKLKKPAHLIRKDFDPGALYWCVVKRVFARFNKATGNKLHSHDLRRRAITKAFAAGLTPDQVGRMFGLDPQTALKHYRDWSAQTVDAEFAAVPGLVPSV